MIPPSHTSNEIELSLVLPCYNEQTHLEQSLREWIRGLGELTPHFEVIVINNGSRDRSGRVLDRLRKEFTQVRVIHQLGGGVERAYRRGLEMARGTTVIQGECTGRYRLEDYTHLWHERDMGELLLGYRPSRSQRWQWGDALIRRFARFLFRAPFDEPALPLRLYRGRTLRHVLASLPKGRESVNLLLTLSFHHLYPRGVQQVAVPYRDRVGGKTRRSLGSRLASTMTQLIEMVLLRVDRTRWNFLAKPLDAPS